MNDLNSLELSPEEMENFKFLYCNFPEVHRAFSEYRHGLRTKDSAFLSAMLNVTGFSVKLKLSAVKAPDVLQEAILKYFKE